MKLGWKEIFTIAGVGFAWTTAPLFAQNGYLGQNQQAQPYQAPVNGQYAQPYQSAQPINYANAPIQQVGQQQSFHYTPPTEVQNQYPQQAFTQQYQLPASQAQMQQMQNMNLQPVQYQTPGAVAPQAFTQQQPVPNQPRTLGTSPWNGSAPSAQATTQSYAAQPYQNQNYNAQQFSTQQFSAPAQQIQPVQQVQPFSQPVVQQQQTYFDQSVASQNFSPASAAPQPVQAAQPTQQYQTQYGVAANEQLQTASFYSPISCDSCGPQAGPSCQSGTCNSADSYCGISTGGYGTDACGTVGCYEPEDCCRSSYYAGFEFMWLQPNFQENVGIVLDPPPNDNIVIPFDYDYEFAPRVWAGWETCDGFGFRFTYWQFDHDLASSQLYVEPTQLALIEVFEANGQLTRNAFAGPGETLETSHSMNLQTADFEFTSRHNFCKHNVLVGAGLRYGKMDQQMIGTAYDNGGMLDEQVNHKHGFEGFGPTVSIDWNRPFDSCGGLSVYSRARGSILFGEAYQDVHEIKNGGANVGYDTYRGDESLAIGELGLGMQYAMLVGCNTEMFVRGGYEAQLWWDAGGPLRTQGDMALHGLTLGFGINH
ncbi:hypothetical protein Pla110_21430 [Polystyrenella longa]|uniref:Uncharacterized protein n=1 Tax=Polystyrenella longa TaxID=2528007 RepID=A0A518CMJ4_9PLAN|nr:hypothetical protein [Polystyrenella longa]QDU80414.1 hypothetical protein Pla110_21430 [Polystyrenella longa]